jgi:hypothetical protein
LLGGYVFDNELIIVNGLITFVGLWLTSSKKIQKPEARVLDNIEGTNLTGDLL